MWVDEEKQELVLQGWKPGPELEAECAAFEMPGHAVGIPEHEAVVRIPARMVPVIREACDAVERAAFVGAAGTAGRPWRPPGSPRRPCRRW